MKRLLLALALLSVLPFLAGAAKSAWDIWREGYETYQKGEAARDRGEYTRAFDFFRKSLELYREIQRLRPDWDQNIIRNRIADSERELDKVRRQLGSDAPANDAETVSPPPVRDAAPKGVDFVEQESRKREMEIYRKKIVDLTVETDQLRKENERLKSNEVDALKLLREQRVQQENITLLEQQVRTLEKQLKEPDTRLEELRKQMIEEKLGSELLAKRLQLAEARGQKLDQDLAALNRAKGLAEAETKASVAETTRLTRELEELRKFRDDALKQRAAYEAAAKEAELKLKTLAVQIETQAAEITGLNRRLNDAAVAGGGAGTLNAELLAENAKLKAAAEAARKALDNSAEEFLALQNKHRAAQLEVVQQKETLLRIEQLRLALEKANAAVTRELERERASSELSAMELKNLRERNGKIEADLKSWSERSARLEEQLKTRDSAISAGIFRSEEENRKLTEELTSLKKQLKTQDEELKLLHIQSASRSEALESANAELARNKSALLLAGEKLDAAKQTETRLAETAARLAEAEARLAKLQPELERFQKDVPAMRKELAANRTLAEELKTTRTALGAAQARLKELEQISARLLEEQKSNQALTEKNRTQAGEIAKLRREAEELRRTAATKPPVAEPVSPATPATPATPVKPLPPLPPTASGFPVPSDRKPAELIAAGRKEEAAERWDLAIWNYEAALTQEPGNAEAARRLGTLVLRRGEYVRAETVLAKAASANPGDAELAAAHAEALIGQGKYGNALSVLEKPLKATPNDFRLRLTLSKALAGSGRKEAASAGFHAAAQLNPSSPEPLLELAKLRLAAGNEKDAVEFYRQARNLGAGPDPDLEPKLGKQLTEQRELAEFMSKAADEAAKSGDWTSALWYYRQLGEIDRGNRRVPLRMAFGHIQSGGYAQALEILAMNPVSAESDLLKVTAYLKQNEFARAKQAAEEALKRSEGKPLTLAPGWPELKAEFSALRRKPELSQSVAGMECVKLLSRLVAE